MCTGERTDQRRQAACSMRNWYGTNCLQSNEALKAACGYCNIMLGHDAVPRVLENHCHALQSHSI